jgi:NAD(P)-dependent dehydrogenase (short-subunit alcohol dehydrogenase family)
MNMKDKVWFITGCSTGFGRELSLMALEHGYSVAVAARNVDDVKDIISKYKEKAVAIKLDMSNPAEIESSVKKVIEAFGRIDLLVNNAGIGYFASMEESDEEEVRRMFEVNFFGLTKLTQLVLPQMRKQKSGHIINVSSIGGIVGYPAVSFYNATKFAVAGLSEALAKETAHLGIKVTIVCPSGFRTDWAGRSANENAVMIDDYKETAGANASNIRGYSGKQAGDPVRAAKEIIAMSESAEPPLYLLLGTAAYNNAKKKLQEMEVNFDKWKDSSINADFPK